MSFADKVAQAPGTPGVYLLKDRRGHVIYVGKARVLRDRLRAYVQPSDHPRIRALQRRVADLETVVTRSEVEALVLEENFIKMKKPRYNVRLRDDKKFPYLKITMAEPFPRIFVTRNLKQDGSVFFGPYTSAKDLRKALKGVKRIFRLRTCKRELAVPDQREQKSEVGSRKSEVKGQNAELASRESPVANPPPQRPCLNFELGRCSGPCTGRLTGAQYRQQVEDVIEFLSGRSDRLIEQIEQRMWRESGAQGYEQAAILRDQLMALRQIRKEQQAALSDKTGRDVIGLARGAHAAVAAMFRLREGKIVAREEYPLTVTEGTTDSELLAAVIGSVHAHTHDLPEEILLPAPIEDAAVLEALFAERRGRKVRIIAPERGDKVRLVELARANAEKALVELAPEEKVPQANRELARVLGLASVPRLIEGVDISNTQGTNAVGSIVVFRDDRPAKQAYRLFRVRTVTGSNDFAMMEEVLARRVRGLLEQNRPLPDLVLVDGGKGQLSSALKAYHEFDRDIPILGLAKRTDTLYYLDGREVAIPASSPALMLLKRIRDESHRFAITYHRKLRGKKMVESELDEIPGLGPARRRALIQHFGSLDKVRLATADEISRVRGFGPALADKVLQGLHR